MMSYGFDTALNVNPRAATCRAATTPALLAPTPPAPRRVFAGRQLSTRERLQIQLAERDDDPSHQAAARHSVIAKLRAGSLGAQRDAALRYGSTAHQLAPEYSGTAEAFGWRHLPRAGEPLINRTLYPLGSAIDDLSTFLSSMNKPRSRGSSPLTSRPLVSTAPGGMEGGAGPLTSRPLVGSARGMSGGGRLSPPSTSPRMPRMAAVLGGEEVASVDTEPSTRPDAFGFPAAPPGTPSGAGFGAEWWEQHAAVSAELEEQLSGGGQCGRTMDMGKVKAAQGQGLGDVSAWRQAHVPISQARGLGSLFAASATLMATSRAAAAAAGTVGAPNHPDDAGPVAADAAAAGLAAADNTSDETSTAHATQAAAAAAAASQQRTYTTPLWRQYSPRDRNATERLYRGERPPPSPKRGKQAQAPGDGLVGSQPLRGRRIAPPPAREMSAEQCEALWDDTARVVPAAKRVVRRMQLLTAHEHLRDKMGRVAASHRKDMEAGNSTDFLKRNADKGNFSLDGLERQKQQREARRETHSARLASRSGIATAESWLAAPSFTDLPPRIRGSPTPTR